MPESKLSTFVIDCQTDDLEAAATFWSRALGRAVKAPQVGDERYRDLVCGPSEPLLMVQKVAHEGRVHLDIESDDVEAEVARLEALGAERIESIRTWVVMRAPTGQRFCVVRPQRAGSEPASLPATAGAEHHARLMALFGSYRGQISTYLDPAAAPERSLGELHVTPLFGGRWLRLEQSGTVMGKPHAGEMLLGYHRDAAQFESCWVDSFHTGSAMMFSTGDVRADGVIAVTGSYIASRERWGWRTELHLGEELFVRAVNISPAGEESLAIEARWTCLSTRSP
jgi:hypothetical protein